VRCRQRPESRQAGSYYDYFYRCKLADFNDTVEELADQLLENGLTLAKITQKYQSVPRTEVFEAGTWPRRSPSEC